MIVSGGPDLWPYLLPYQLTWPTSAAHATTQVANFLQNKPKCKQGCRTMFFPYDNNIESDFFILIEPTPPLLDKLKIIVVRNTLVD